MHAPLSQLHPSQIFIKKCILSGTISHLDGFCIVAYIIHHILLNTSYTTAFSCPTITTMLYNGFLQKAALALVLIGSAQAAPAGLYGTFPYSSPAQPTNFYQPF